MDAQHPLVPTQFEAVAAQPGMNEEENRDHGRAQHQEHKQQVQGEGAEQKQLQGPVAHGLGQKEVVEVIHPPPPFG